MGMAMSDHRLHLGNRTLAAAAFAIVGVVFSGVAHGEENCLSAPNGTTPAGGHWFYRTDPIKKIKCWHLVTEDQSNKVVQQPTADPRATATTGLISSVAPSTPDAASANKATTSPDDVAAETLHAPSPWVDPSPSATNEFAWPAVNSNGAGASTLPESPTEAASSLPMQASADQAGLGRSGAEPRPSSSDQMTPPAQESPFSSARADRLVVHQSPLPNASGEIVVGLLSANVLGFLIAGVALARIIRRITTGRAVQQWAVVHAFRTASNRSA